MTYVNSLLYSIDKSDATTEDAHEYCNHSLYSMSVIKKKIPASPPGNEQVQGMKKSDSPGLIGHWGLTVHDCIHANRRLDRGPPCASLFLDPWHELGRPAWLVLAF